MTQEATTAIILSPRTVATGDPAGDALENINTNTLADGSLCYVSSGAQGEWQLQKESTDTPNGTTIVEPTSGPGRWFLKITPGSLSGATLRSTRAQASSSALLTTGTQFELKETPQDVAGSVTAPFMRPELLDCREDRLYEVEMTLPLNWSALSTESIYLMTLEISPDGGTTWHPIPNPTSNNTNTNPAGAAVQGGSNYGPFVSPRVLGSSITGFVSGGALEARATFEQAGGDAVYQLTGDGDIPTLSCTLREIVG